MLSTSSNHTLFSYIDLNHLYENMQVEPQTGKFLNLIPNWTKEDYFTLGLWLRSLQLPIC